MRTVIHRTTRLLGGLALLAGILLAMNAPARAQTITATPHNVIVATDATQGATTITWDAGAGIKSVGATLWQQIDGGKETLVAAKAKGSQSILIGAGETRVFKLHNFIKSKVLASVTVTASKQGAAPNAADDTWLYLAVASTGSFSGTWPTIAGGTHEYTVRLQQVGNKVKGSYSPGNGKIFDGIVVGRKLTFNWSQNGGFEGTGEFTLDEDGKGFKGSSTALRPQQFTNTWNSFVPEPPSFAGEWETTSNNGQSTMRLQQIGDKVAGTYTPNDGKIEGTIKDRILRFKWTSDGGAGSGRFVIDKSEMLFNGSYSNSDDPEQTDGLWNGTRKLGGGGGKTTVNFDGTWVQGAKIGDRIRTLTYKFEQTGNKVTGYASLDNEEKQKLHFEGVVSGNTLRFRVTPAVRDSDGEFVMAQDGKSFKGTVGKTPVTATFLGR